MCLAPLAAPLVAHAQRQRLYRIGVVFLGGSYALAINGLRDGLKELGLEEGRHVVLHVREPKGDASSVETAARALEAEKVDLIYTITSAVTAAAKRATTSVPIVFYGGNDPVSMGFVDSFRKPGGRLTGIYSRFTDLTAKRFQLLKEMVPELRRIAAFYRPESPATAVAIKAIREAARDLQLSLLERQFTSVDELRNGLLALRAGEVQAFYSVDAVVISQAQLVVDIANEKRLATIFSDRDTAAKGALATYGTSYYAVGRLAAGKVARILKGANPGDLPVEQLDRLYLVINLKTARALGLAIPQSLLARADEVIQ